MTRTRWQVASRDAVGRDRWDAFVDASDDAWFFHRFDVQEALCTWPMRRDASLAVVDDASGALDAIVPLQVVDTRAPRILGWRRLESPGMAASAALDDAARGHLLGWLSGHLEEVAARWGAMEVMMQVPPLAPSMCGARAPRVNPLLEHGFENATAHSWIVDLGVEEAEIERRYAVLTRRELRKIRQTAFTIRAARGEPDLETYYALHCETYRRTGVTPHPRAYFQTIFDRLVPAGLSRIVFLERDGIVSAAQNTALYKGGAYYWTGASRTDRSAGDNRVLFDDQIRTARRLGCEHYDVGEAFPHVRHGKLKGLNDFKRSFGGGLFPNYRGRLVVRPRARAIASCFRVLRAVHD